MRWRSGRRSRNIEDRRGIRIGRKTAGGGIGVIVIALIAMYFGVDPSVFLNPQGPPSVSTPSYSVSTSESTEERQLVEFVSVVLADTEDTWHALFQRWDKTYQEPTLVLFSGAVESACGYAQAAVGPFYCPRDQKVY
jgi:predicted metalloprotease